MNYCLALMSIKLSTYAIATACAVIPYTLLYAYLGSVSTDIIKTLSGGGSGDDDGGDGGGGGGTLRIAGLLASLLLFVGLVVYLGSVIKRAVAAAGVDAGGGAGSGSPAAGSGDVVSTSSIGGDSSDCEAGERVPLLINNSR